MATVPSGVSAGDSVRVLAPDGSGRQVDGSGGSAVGQAGRQAGGRGQGGAGRESTARGLLRVDNSAATTGRGAHTAADLVRGRRTGSGLPQTLALWGLSERSIIDPLDSRALKSIYSFLVPYQKAFPIENRTHEGRLTFFGAMLSRAVAGSRCVRCGRLATG